MSPGPRAKRTAGVSDLKAFEDRTLSTLARGRRFTVLGVDDSLVRIEVGSTKRIRPIRRYEIEKAWENVVTHTTLTRGDIGGWSSAYMAVLATFPGVGVETEPIPLWFGS